MTLLALPIPLQLEVSSPYLSEALQLFSSTCVDLYTDDAQKLAVRRQCQSEHILLNRLRTVLVPPELLLLFALP